MSLIKGSTNYIWWTTSSLGKGATGAVYQGVHKLTGKAVAVKTFNQISQMRPQDVQMREFDALKMVNHENIVKLLAIEEEQTSLDKVIVMELCTGGSLFSILDDPENHYGLSENEFIIVINHLASGMNHLRERKLIHRDLKPGNIMKYISEDGRSIYKLVDFGAARKLDDDQQFMSLYGTEEYLHPDMYERAVLHKPASKTFDATVDLWSIGVTLYHIATGALPFRPYGGRSNRETMHCITTEKESGMISGVQLTENGKIDWSDELPKTCQFSLGLRARVTPILAGLLECDQHKMWGFAKFFSKVTELVSKVVVHMVYINEMKQLRLYMDQNYSMKNLQDEIMRQTGVTASNQLSLHNDAMLNESLYSDDKISKTVTTSLENPVVMIDRSNSLIEDRLSCCLLVKFPIFPSTITSVQNDSALGKISCSVAYAVQRQVQVFTYVQKAFLKVPQYLCSSIKNDILKLKILLDEMKSEFLLSNSRLDVLASLHKSLMQLMALAGEDENSEEDVFIKRIDEVVNESLQSKLTLLSPLKEVEAKINDMHVNFTQNKQFELDWKALTQNIHTDLSKCPTKAMTYTHKIRESWQALVRDKASRNLNFHEEQFHKLEKIKIHDASQKEMVILQDETINNSLQLAERLERWYSTMLTTLVQISSIKKKVHHLNEEIKVHKSTLKQAELEYRQQTEMVISMMKNKQSFDSHNKQSDEKIVRSSVKIVPQPSRPCSCDGIGYKRLQELANAQAEIKSALYEHKQMIHEFEELTLLLVESNISNAKNEH